MGRKDEDKELAANLSTIITALGTLFLGGLFLYVTWNAIANACGLPTFEYMTCVCAIGALDIISGCIRGIFKRQGG